MGSLGIVVPAYRPDVDRLRTYVTALDERLAPARVVIELDAPRAGVAEALSDTCAAVHVASRRRGKGAAIAAGFDRLADDDIRTLAFFDADASTPPDSAAAVLTPVVSGAGDLAVGSRRHPAADVGRHQTLGRRRLGDAFAWCVRRCVEPRLYDYQCGAKALSTAVWRDVRGYLRETGFGWDLELTVLAAALGYEVREVPIAWHDRPRSTVPPARTALALARSLYHVRRRAGRIAARTGSATDRSAANGTPEATGERRRPLGERRTER